MVSGPVERTRWTARTVAEISCTLRPRMLPNSHAWMLLDRTHKPRGDAMLLCPLGSTAQIDDQMWGRTTCRAPHVNGPHAPSVI